MNNYKYIIIFAVLVFCGTLNSVAQEIMRGMPWPDNTPIPLYETSTSYTPSTYIVQGPHDENWYDAVILETSYLRFKVNLTNDYNDNVIGKPMWINKTDLAITALANGYDDNGGYLILYSDKELLESQKIYLDEISKIATPLEYDLIDGKMFVKVTFLNDSTLYVGWISRYCDNYYQSCN